MLANEKFGKFLGILEKIGAKYIGPKFDLGLENPSWYLQILKQSNSAGYYHLSVEVIFSQPFC